jgi:hypothetical protein
MTELFGKSLGELEFAPPPLLYITLPTYSHAEQDYVQS